MKYLTVSALVVAFLRDVEEVCQRHRLGLLPDPANGSTDPAGLVVESFDGLAFGDLGCSPFVRELETVSRRHSLCLKSSHHPGDGSGLVVAPLDDEVLRVLNWAVTPQEWEALVPQGVTA